MAEKVTSSRVVKSTRILRRRRTVTRGETVTFYQASEDPGAFDTIAVIKADAWREMGSPLTITVTIEPGDKLNPEPVVVE